MKTGYTSSFMKMENSNAADSLVRGILNPYSTEGKLFKLNIARKIAQTQAYIEQKLKKEMIVDPIVLKKGMSDNSPNSPTRRKDSEVFEQGIQS